ncbi:hypothetical protein [Patulibacter sp.]|uniref:hypothetical protein n=1 Tax=Patulibacter sp. TaxID=1912859 RepID=UPI0027293CCA|nr:hypothetical protein [Patulibacter sp.]MDO9407395.1 hypothetical protein [Patulibacter sp.]
MFPAGPRRDVPRTSVLPRLLVVAALALPALGLQTGVAAAAPDPAFGLSAFEGTVLRPPAPDDGPDGPHYADLAGEHPDTAIVDFSIASKDGGPDSEPSAVADEIRVDIPAGLVPNPAGFPTCTNAQLDAQVAYGSGEPLAEADACPVGSQVGFINLTVRGDVPLFADIFPGTPARQTMRVQLPVYNMTRGAGQVGRFAFLPGQAPASPALEGDKSRVDIVGGVRPSDNGLYFTIKSPESLPLLRSKLTFWGTPGLATHDEDRGKTLTEAPNIDVVLGPSNDGKDMSGLDRTATFLTNPTLCAGKLRTTVRVRAFDGQTTDGAFDTPYGALGCDSVPFSPSVAFSSSEPVRADSPTGLDVSLKVPQSSGTSERGSAQIKDATVTLPEGFSISPSAASTIGVCSDEQLGQGTDSAVSCPAASKVGTASISSPIVDSPLTGSVFLGAPLPGDRYRLFLVAEGHGVTIKLKGTVRPDPATGRVSATFADNPQLPFSELRLSFSGGPKAILASPPACGDLAGSAALTPFSRPTASTVSGSVPVSGCTGAAFAPDATAAVASGRSGTYSPAAFAFSRPDGQPTLSGLKIALPVGMTAKVKGIAHCTDAQVAAAACPESSRIGSVSTLAGPGSAPFPLTGAVYLTDGHNGGDFGSVAIIRALAGPYDLGNVVVRQALRIDPKTAQVTIDSDPLPQIVEGIPLRLRNLTLDVNRKNLLRNPTSCGTAGVTSTLTGAGGATSVKAPGLTFSGCKDLPFRPKITVGLSNRTQVKKGRNPRLTAKITQFESEAGIRSAQVALPKTLALAASNAQALCAKAAAAKNACPKASIVGSASATTTILDRPLNGPVYFVKGERTTAAGKVVATLPTLHVQLRGQASIDLDATTAVNHGRLVTTFASIPDQPLRSFTLNVDGGKHGIIALTRDLCTKGPKPRASARFAAHSGKKAPTRAPVVSTVCRTAKKK